MRLRCRFGLHRWARFKETDPDVEDRGPTAEWQTRCRDCGRAQGTGAVWATIVFSIVLIAAIWCLFAGPPLLGAILMIGGVGGLFWSAGAVLGSRFVRWMSVG